MGTEPYLGEIVAVGFNFAPLNWMFCDGQVLRIEDNGALFSILGTQYGGNGLTTFALPDLRGRVPVHTGPGVSLGERGGADAVALTAGEMPVHGHGLTATTATATTTEPGGALPARVGRLRGPRTYAARASVTLATTAVGEVGAGVPHENRQPYLALNFIICTRGVFPSRS